ncbi:MAG: hypothetical protein JWQ30_2139, partial [Sediminibacterium sp.]|nr:hypothetical protein [Sediminibacterium sp.]
PKSIGMQKVLQDIRNFSEQRSNIQEIERN